MIIHNPADTMNNHRSMANDWLRQTVYGLLVCLIGLFPAGVLFADKADDAYQLAAGFYKKERWDLAASGFAKFITENPQHPRVPTARFFQGLSLVNTGDFKAARDVLGVFVKEAPMSRNLGHALYRIAV